MPTHWLTTAFVLALTAHTAMQWWLSARQARHVAAHRNRVPQAFADLVTPAEHAKAADYTVARQRLGRWETLYDIAWLLVLTLGGGIETLGRAAASLGFGSPVITGTVQVMLVMLLLGVVSLPFAVWRTFRLEQRFGFNRTTPALFVADVLKSAALGALLGSAVVATVLAVMTSAGRHWWWFAWVAWMVFTLVLLWAWPRWIAGLFNKFTPLSDQTLRERIDALLARCGFHASHVYVMDGSKRSAHGNAYFTGLGREKRIVFFDTLLQTLTPPQVESVLAHELAHFKLRHIPQRLVVSALTSLAGFALLGWLATQAWFYSALGVSTPGPASALLLFVLAVPTFTWVLSPLAAAWSRRHEYQADAFAARYSSGPELAHALVRLYRENASTLTPDPVHSAFYDSHPPPVQRIARLSAQSAGTGAPVPGPTAAPSAPAS
jgi:STE24 endopeptidase